MSKIMPNLPGLFFLKSYPPEQIWRLLVDGRFWSKEKGWHGYESRERGSINAALESLCSIALQVYKEGETFELSVDLIKEIHKKCGRKVEALEDKSPGEIRTDEPVSFGIPACRASIEGIEEFLQLSFLIDGGASFGPGNPGPFGPSFDLDYFKDLTPEKIPELAKKIYEDMRAHGYSNTNHFYLAVRKKVDVFLEAITQSYNKEIKAAKNLDEKLYVIAKHIRQYEVLHPFKDANGRTFVNNLLNILLMQQGLPPATFYEPNVFDLYSADQLVVVIKEAILNTVEILEHNKKGISLYGYSETLEDKAKFMEMLDSPSYQEIRDIDFSFSDIGRLYDNTRECLEPLKKKYPLHRGAIYLSEPRDINELVFASDEAQINECIKQGAPPIYVGKAPIHLAVMMHNIAMIDALIANKADLSIQDYDGKTALHYAAESGNMQIMGKILTVILSQKNALAVLNAKDNQGKTAFHYAAEYGNPELVVALTSTDEIQINETDKRGSSPIFLAYKNHKQEVFEKLLDSGAEITKDLLDEVLVRNDKEALKKIIKKNKELLTTKEIFYIALSIGSRSIVKQFLQTKGTGIDINTPITDDKGTPLMLAVQRGDIRLVNYLLEKGADTSKTDGRGYTALHYVFYTQEKSREELIKVLLKQDKRLVNQLNDNHCPPLYNAMVLRDVKSMQLLLKMGAKVDYVDTDGNNILHATIGRSPLPMIHEIVSRDPTLLHKRNPAGRNPLHHGLAEVFRYSEDAEINFMALSNYLLKEQVDLNTEDMHGQTMLDIALSKHFYQLCVKLIKAGAQPNISSASTFLQESDANSILNHPKTFKKKLGKTLDENPLIAMTQLNDLYLQIKKNLIKSPKNFVPQSSLAFFKGKSEDTRAHDQVLSVLKESYDSKLKELLGSYKGQHEHFDKRHQVLDENLKFLIKNHEISKRIEKPTTQLVEGEYYQIKW
ncbi:ankyrin repeat domain-containing protein [Legionella sp. PATHC038]|uniref:Dot/Icm T4SS effector AnkN/AnkX/LegA8 n=1 Tax=Legionella sheltonii TaxID=2992041 RepID=UPI0022437DE0|nr:Dot/Icm T4SS effector AnkN/AnkX/LegA8 [Legionella sp. PATHC038]MCW8398062.1 ankyrin repeat domain-containing protein [Legionella sp. PATHC038]